MKAAKEFRWEMGHRLPEHFDKCKNIHGHSYKMIVEFDGDVMDKGMVIDFYDIKKIVQPLIEKLDHAFLVYKDDKDIIEFLDKVRSKKVVVDFQSTVENICAYFINEIKKTELPKNINQIKVRVHETPVNYAEETVLIAHKTSSKNV